MFYQEALPTFTCVCVVTGAFSRGVLGTYKRNVIVVIKMGAYIHGVLILCGCLLSRFYCTTSVGLIRLT